jgi:hypothetical protein
VLLAGEFCVTARHGGDLEPDGSDVARSDRIPFACHAWGWRRSAPRPACARTRKVSLDAAVVSAIELLRR